ncbi:hypothetical protein AVEN_33483-1 [Araneus ventricosus]|uniref:Uncharacterized protein n=1 Tax=Araneus ventricosus TaxID=182803 RepID=A0A4Y2GUN5_ARAVE|nr:hypothetical protein AVEN_33483-1 [Araneus ventricosus]
MVRRFDYLVTFSTNTQSLRVQMRRNSVRKSFHLPYDGSYAVVKRGDNLYKVNIKGKLVNISIDILKPAFVAADSDMTIPSVKDIGDSHTVFPYKTKSGRTVRFPAIF